MLLVIISAFFSGLSQHSIGIEWIILFSIIPLIHTLSKSTTMIEFIQVGFIWGFIYNIVTIYWLAFNIGVTRPVGLLSMIAAVIFLSINYLFITLIYYYCKRVCLISNILLLPSIWVTIEYFRSFFALGFPWISLGNTQATNILVAQNVEVTGIYGITFWIVLVNILLYRLFLNRNKNNLVIALSIAFIPFITGLMLINRIDTNNNKLLNATIIQPNVHLHDKRKKGFSQENIVKLMQMSMTNISDSTDLIIWPETSTISYLLQNNKNQLNFIQKGLRGYNTSLLTGLPYYERNQDRNFIHYNSIAHINSDTVLNVYHKILLVPIAESVPLSSTFPSLKKINIGQANFTRGTEYTIFNINSHKIGAMVCFESTFPQHNRQFVLNGAEVLVYLVNDGWYLTNPEPKQHAKQAIFRAIEFRRPVIRCANTGISQIIDINGNIEKQIELNESGVINASIIPSNYLTFYAKFGDVFAIFNLLILVSLLIISKKKK